MESAENQTVVSSRARQESVVPWLSAAPRLVHNLGWCMSFAATREVARIKLTAESLESTDLSTNLVQIADEGQNAFMDAYTDLLDISNGTWSMTRENGYFDRLEEALGRPNSERATTRALESICETIDECEHNGKRTANQFKAWRRTVQKVERAVIATQRSTQSSISVIGEDKKVLTDELKMQDLQMSQKAAEVRDANEEYRRIVKLHEAREEKLREYTDHAVNCATLGITVGMFGAVLGAAGSAALMAFSGDRASTLETELQHKAQVSRELQSEMLKVRNALDGKMSDEEKLEKMFDIIIIVCQLLGGLCNDIRILLTQFARLNSTIKQLVREHKDTKKTVRDLKDDLADGDDDETPTMNELQYETFRNQMYEMRKLSVEINSMASLYADVIVDVINPGFSKVVEAAYEDGGETNSSVVIYNKQTGMNDYLNEAEKTCRAREQAADTKLREQLAQIKATHARERVRRQSSASRRENREGRVANLNGGGRERGLFSRMFSRN